MKDFFVLFEVQGLAAMWEAKQSPRKKTKPNDPPLEVAKEEEPRKSILKNRSESKESDVDRPKKSVTFNPKSRGLLPDNEIEEFLTKSGDEAKKSKKKKGLLKKDDTTSKEKIEVTCQNYVNDQRKAHFQVKTAFSFLLFEKHITFTQGAKIISLSPVLFLQHGNPVNWFIRYTVPVLDQYKNVW